MPYLVVEDFKAGLDRRKMPEASPPGTLQTLVNGHITRGGEIEKRRAFVPRYSLPPLQTFGLAGANGILYTFGSDDEPAVPAPIIYQRLEHPDGHAMDGIVKSEFYDGKLFVTAHYENGSTLQFYDGARVEDWDANTDPDAPITQGQAATSLLTVRDKMYATFGSVLGFSGIDEPTNWDDATGAGFKNMANQSAGSETLTGLGRYQNLIAVFARRTIQLWYVDPDPVQNAQRQVLEHIGTISPKSIVSFGQVDVFFLADTGVRSLRARDSSNQASAEDVGTPIDESLTDYMSTLPEAVVAKATGVIDPKDGRYLVSVGDRTFVFSNYTSSRIAAWSEYALGFRVDDYVSMDGSVYVRGNDTVFQLGGATGKEFDETEVVVETPYLDARQVATFKEWQGIDIICRGTWEIYAGTDPEQPDAMSHLGTITGSSIGRLKEGMVGKGPLIRFRLVCISEGPARFSKLIAHFQSQESG